MKHYADLFNNAGVKLTHQRLVILEKTLARRDHPSAESVFREVRETLPTISLDTVYRTLWLLDELGLVAALSPEREKYRFDTDPHPHHHFICMECGEIWDSMQSLAEELHVPEEIRKFGVVRRIQVEFRGLCHKCERETLLKKRTSL